MNQPRAHMCSPSRIPLPPPLPSHPPGSSSQCTSPEYPVSCIEPGRVICFTYDNIHISMLPSQIIPLSPFRLSQMSCFTFSLQCFSSDLHYCLDVGIELLLQFPHLPRAGPVLLTPLLFPLFPSSYWVLPGSIYSFLVGRYSCPLSAGVLQGLLCLKVYSSCIHGERCAPHSPTPLPSCPLPFGFNADFSEGQRGRHWISFTVATSIAYISLKLSLGVGMKFLWIAVTYPEISVTGKLLLKASSMQKCFTTGKTHPVQQNLLMTTMPNKQSSRNKHYQAQYMKIVARSR